MIPSLIREARREGLPKVDYEALTKYEIQSQKLEIQLQQQQISMQQFMQMSMQQNQMFFQMMQQMFGQMRGARQRSSSLHALTFAPFINPVDLPALQDEDRKTLAVYRAQVQAAERAATAGLKADQVL